MQDTPIVKLLLRLSPPVMAALLIQSVYNIVDSYFVARYSAAGLTALSLVFPIQLLMTALATGTGMGVNILLARMDGAGDSAAQKDIVQSGLALGVFNFLTFAAVGLLFVKGYYALSSGQAAVRAQGVQYAQIVFAGSLGMFMEANCTKILQAKGDMLTPMAAQITGAVLNILLDPILIFGLFGLPALGTAGAAIATVAGQWASMGITLLAVRRRFPHKGRLRWGDCLRIYQSGLPSILMQSLYTLYIVGLNLILKQFTEDAVTVLGIYYKLQTFFFIPLMGLQQVILPIISFNHGAGQPARVRQTLRCSTLAACGMMLLAALAFFAVPRGLLSIFSTDAAILAIGERALRVIAVSFVPAGLDMMVVVYFQGVGRGGASIFITVLRQIVLLVPLAWLFHFAGLGAVWYTFPATELIAAAACLWLMRGPAKAPPAPADR